MKEINKEIADNIGIVIRKLRREKNITQKDLAIKLQISLPYVNLIENNKRKITIPLLLKVAKTFDIDISQLTTDYNRQLNSDLIDIFTDGVFDEHKFSNDDIKELTINSPKIGDAVRTLYDKYIQNRKNLALLADQMISVKQEISDTVGSESSTTDIISDMLQSNNNYFPQLENISSQLFNNLNMELGNKLNSLIVYLKEKFSIKVIFPENSIEENFSKKYIADRKLLKISNTLSRESKEFMLAHQIGLIVAKEEINKQLKADNIEDENTKALGKNVLANYFASSLLMPYDKFWNIAEKHRYDIDVLVNRFDTSFEQVCHRLTTLQKKEKLGIPFHFMRVDIAGNVSKRFSLSGLKIPRYSVACPRWNVYTAFLNPGKIKIQLSKMSDGSTFVCFAKTVSKKIGDYNSPETFFSIGMGFDIKYSQRSIYADGLNFNKPNLTGLSCRTCERENCTQRAFPPIHKKMRFDENVRGLSGYTNPDG